MFLLESTWVRIMIAMIQITIQIHQSSWTLVCSTQLNHPWVRMTFDLFSKLFSYPILNYSPYSPFLPLLKILSSSYFSSYLVQQIWFSIITVILADLEFSPWIWSDCVNVCYCWVLSTLYYICKHLYSHLARCQIQLDPMCDQILLEDYLR
jgi:hypothetical protein